ncbi:MAG: BPSS1780 family membrane protein [Pseudomonadota bacterium]
MRTQDVPARHGWLWIKQGVSLFKKAPLPWLTMSMLWSLLLAITILVLWPLGAFVVVVLYPLLVAIWLRGCQQVDETGDLKISETFTGLRPQLGSLLALGILIVFAQTTISFFASKLVPLDPELIKLVAKYPDFTPEDAEAAAPSLLTFTIVQLIASIPIFLASWFAPPLIVFRGMKIWHAIRWSVYASISNIGALSLYGLACAIPLLIAGGLPGMLSAPITLVLTPIFFATIYAGYRDIFIDTPEPIAEEVEE